MKKFDYKSAYKKYRSGDTVKITFMDDEVPVTKTVRIISIDDKKVSFEDKENVYECTSSEIVNIKNTLLKKILHIELLLLLIIFLPIFIFGTYFTIFFGDSASKISSLLIWSFVFIATLIIPLRSRNPKVMFWGLYPLISIPLLIFFNFDTLGIKSIEYIDKTIDFMEYEGHFSAIFNTWFLDEALRGLMFPFAIIITEFICCYQKQLQNIIKKIFDFAHICKRLLRAFIWLELFLMIGFVLFIFQDYTFSISGAYGSVHYKTEAILIWLLIFIGTFVVPLRTKNPKIMLWGLYPLISVPLLIFFGADTLGIHIIEQSPDFSSIFSSEYLYIASQFLLYPFAIIIAEFVCNYPKSPLTKKRLVILFYWLAFLYVCILGIRILNENKYWEECQKDASYMGNGYFGQYNVFTGCSLIYDRTWNYGDIEYLED